MRTLWLGLTRSLHARACENARHASIELSRRRVEREEVELFVAALAEEARAGSRAQHPAYATAVRR